MKSLIRLLLLLLSTIFGSSSAHGSTPPLHPLSAKGWQLTNAIRHQEQLRFSRRNSHDSSILLASRKNHRTSSSNARASTPSAVTNNNNNNADDEFMATTYDYELGLVGKTIVGSVQILVTVAVEYATGFVGGYVLGAVAGLPGWFTPTNDPSGGAASNLLGDEMKRRLARWNGKAVRWGSQWAPISAVYGGCDAATRVLRGNVKDQWNTVLSSAAAGAYFNRQGGPTAMLRGAAMYGGITYLLSGGMMTGKQQQFGYREEAIEF